MTEALDYRTRADQYRPTDQAIIDSEIRRMAASGLKAMDISVALRIGLGQVRDALNRDDPPECQRSNPTATKAD